MDFLADKTMTSNPWCPLWWETTGEEIPQECGDDREKEAGPFDANKMALVKEYVSGSGPSVFYFNGTFNDVGGESMLFDVSAKDCGMPASLIKATKNVLSAYSLDRSGRLEEAHKSLEMNENCVEAYCVLGFCAKNFQDALEQFEKGISLAPKLSPNFAQILKKKEAWGHHIMRGYIRCLLGAANCLRKMKRYKEALDYYLKLVELDNNFYPHHSSYVNYRYHIPEMFLRLKDYEGCRKYMYETSKKVLSESLEYNSSALPWIFSIALLNYATNKQRKYPTETDDFMASIKSGKAAGLGAAKLGSRVIKYLRGDEKIPVIPMPSSFGIPVSELQAIVYATSAIDLWRSVDGAIDWLSKTFNTYWAIAHVRNDLEYFGPKGADTFEFYQKCIEGGVFYDQILNEHKFFLHEIVLAPHTTKQHLDLALKYTKNVNTSMALTPMNMACYYDVHPDLINSLMDHGAQIYYPARNLQESPLAMAANQGNWRAIKVALDRCPELQQNNKKKSMLLEDLAELLCSSSVPYCLEGSEKCQRCSNESSTHSPTTSFKKSVDLLIDAGLSPSFRPSMTHHPVSGYIRTRLRGGKAQGDEELAARQRRSSGRSHGHSHAQSGSHGHSHSSPSSHGHSHSSPSSHGHSHSHGGSSCDHNHSHSSPSSHGHSHSHSQPNSKHCSACGKPKENLLKCSRCKSAFYCDKDCQKADWPAHKLKCSPPKDL